MGGWQGKRKHLVQCHSSVCNWLMLALLILEFEDVPVSPLTQGCSCLGHCREPNLGGFGTPAAPQGSRMALAAKKTNRFGPWEAEKVPGGPTEVPFPWPRLLSDAELGAGMLTGSCYVPELQPGGRTCPRLIPALLCCR